jgi:hypothetical protein
MKRMILMAGGLFTLAACSGMPALTGDQKVAATATAERIQRDVDAVQAACAEAMPIATMAGIIPVIGTYIAEGVKVGCGSANGVAALVERPGSAQWLGEQIQMMKAGLSRVGKRSKHNFFDV